MSFEVKPNRIDSQEEILAFVQENSLSTAQTVALIEANSTSTAEVTALVQANVPAVSPTFTIGGA